MLMRTSPRSSRRRALTRGGRTGGQRVAHAVRGGVDVASGDQRVGHAVDDATAQLLTAVLGRPAHVSSHESGSASDLERRPITRGKLLKLSESFGRGVHQQRGGSPRAVIATNVSPRAKTVVDGRRSRVRHASG
jgi:hypothetical protein